MDNIIDVKGLKRSFKTPKNGEFEAIKGIEFSVKEGEIFGLLGPNGAGKTTMIKILTTMLAPSAGEAKVFGFDTFSEAKKVREYINFVFGGERSLYWRLSARDNLAYFADLYKIPSKDQKELIEKLIRYANRYRKDNIEFHQQLTVAEQYYREYRYNKTLEIIRNALDKVEPGAYERIRNSVKAN